MQKRKNSFSLKRLLLLFLVFYGVITLIPLGAWGVSRIKGPSEKKDPVRSPAEAEGEPSAPSNTQIPEFLDAGSRNIGAKNAQDSFLIYDAAQSRLFDVSVEEFLPAALACEMDLSAPKEALKAQAVAIFTLYRWKQENEEKVQGADFACDSENWLVYVTKEQMRQRWGEDFEEYYRLLQQVCKETAGELLTWEGKPICACYFAIGAGSTETAGNIWEEDLPYLKAVASPGDLLCDGFLTTVDIPFEELISKLTGAFPERALDSTLSKEDWFQREKRTPRGYLQSLSVMGADFTGAELRDALSLRSTNFQVALTEEGFHFTVKGWGHGVGMSQAGAIFLAKQGADYREILAHYYPGSTLLSAV